MKKMLAVTFCLCFWSLFGVFGVETDVSVSVMEGVSVTLKNDDTEILRDDQIMWKFGQILIAQINRDDNKIKLYEKVADGRFRGRIQLDQTGSLIITNFRTTDSGQYKLFTTSKETPLKIFTVTVYARLPVPVITSDSSLNSSSSESSSKCVLVCSVVNVTQVTLSWYKGNSLLSSISVSDLNRSLSLHLECVDDSYRCVINNPIRNQTKHLDITEVCQTCSGVFGVETDVSVSVMEGDSVTLKIDDTQILRDDGIMWTFGPKQFLIAQISRDDKNVFDDVAADGRFRGRIQLDQTGSLIITNIRTTDSGQYKLITTSKETLLKIFTLTVYESERGG